MDNWQLEPARDLGLPYPQRVRSLQRESGLLETAGHLGWWSAVRTYLKVCHRLTVAGQDNLPAQPPFVLVANHASHLDALVLVSVLPWRLWDRVFPIAAGDTFFETPVMAALAAGAMNALPMWRRNCGPHALRQLRERLVAEPCAYILFPEGTRSRDGTMGSFKAGLGMLVAETQVPVVPCHLAGTFESLPPQRRVPLFRRIQAHIGPPLAFADAKNDTAGWKTIARAAEEGVRRLRS
jgi:1-acyl-sn-glycerol-3-phosphate acyltransferase